MEPILLAVIISKIVTFCVTTLCSYIKFKINQDTQNSLIDIKKVAIAGFFEVKKLQNDRC